MKLFASTAVALALASSFSPGFAVAQTSTSGTASGSTAPTNQNSMATTAPGGGTSFGTLRSTTTPDDPAGGAGTGVGDTSTNGTQGVPGWSGTAGTYGTGSTLGFGNPNYLTPYGSFPYGEQGTVRGYALPIPLQQIPAQQNGTTSATTMSPMDANASPTPSPTP